MAAKIPWRKRRRKQHDPRVDGEVRKPETHAISCSTGSSRKIGQDNKLRQIATINLLPPHAGCTARKRRASVVSSKYKDSVALTPNLAPSLPMKATDPFGEPALGFGSTEHAPHDFRPPLVASSGAIVSLPSLEVVRRWTPLILPLQVSDT